MRARSRWTEESIVAALRDWAHSNGEVPTAVDWSRWAAYEHGGPERLARLNALPAAVPNCTTVIARFGSWKAAIAAAGLQPRSAARALDRRVIAHTVALYESGLSTAQVAERQGIAPKTVRDRLHAAGVALRPPRARAPGPQQAQPPSARRRGLPDPETEAAILAAYEQGATQDQLAERFALTNGQIQGILARHDVASGALVRHLRAHLHRLDRVELTQRQRAVVQLVVQQRLTQPDAATRLGLSRTTIYRDLRTATTRLHTGDG